MSCLEVQHVVGVRVGGKPEIAFDIFPVGHEARKSRLFLQKSGTALPSLFTTARSLLSTQIIP